VDAKEAAWMNSLAGLLGYKELPEFEQRSANSLYFLCHSPLAASHYIRNYANRLSHEQ